MSRPLNETDVSAFEEGATDLFVDPASSRDGEALQITGLEILAFIAAKIALPALVAFSSRALYDKWRKPLTRADLDALRKELVGKSLSREPAVPRAELIADAIAKLVAEGLDEEKARRIAGEIVDKATAKAAG